MSLNGAELARQYPHEFSIQYPPRREYFQEHFRDATKNCKFAPNAKWLLYIHVPFCESKCSYCNFSVDLRKNVVLQQKYIRLLIDQLEYVKTQLDLHDELVGIDIGGGTPTILPNALLDELASSVAPLRQRSRHAFPVSIETTPAIAAQHPDKFAMLAERGIDRVSVGLQTASEDCLIDMNRKQQVNVNAKAIRNLKRLPFQRLNVDLIFGLPGQNIDQWQRDLHQAVELEPDSITTYDCLYRGKGRALTKRTPALPTPHHYGQLYDFGWRFLLANGYFGNYGGLNFSRRPDETGTSAYFEGRLLDGLPYLGLGNYASSMCGSHWWFAPYGVDQWMKQIEGQVPLPVGDAYLLPSAERMAKYILLSLNFGMIDEARFYRVFGEAFHDNFGPELAFAVDFGWLEFGLGRWTIPQGKFKHLPELRSLFYSKQAIDWLTGRREDTRVRVHSISDVAPR